MHTLSCSICIVWVICAKKVAVPIRLENNEIGEAMIIATALVRNASAVQNHIRLKYALNVERHRIVCGASHFTQKTCHPKGWQVFVL